jgi:hypothetical protein
LHRNSHVLPDITLPRINLGCGITVLDVVRVGGHVAAVSWSLYDHTIEYTTQSRRILEFLEPKRQTVSIRAVLTPPRQLDHLPDDSLQPEFEKRAIVNVEQPVRDMNAEIRVDPDQVGVESGHDGSSSTAAHF